MAIKVFFTEKNVQTDLEAIREAGRVLIEAGKADPEFTQACLERETSYPTGMELPNDNAVALPHGGAAYVHESSISVLRTDTPVTFRRMDDDELTVSCNLIFNLAIDTGGMQLDVLRRLMALFQNGDFLAHCLNDPADGLADFVSGQLGL